MDEIKNILPSVSELSGVISSVLTLDGVPVLFRLA